jgi:hypothetical protein
VHDSLNLMFAVASTLLSDDVDVLRLLKQAIWDKRAPPRVCHYRASHTFSCIASSRIHHISAPILREAYATVVSGKHATIEYRRLELV